MNKAKLGKETIVTVTRTGDIMEGFQGVVWDFDVGKSHNCETYTVVKFHKKIVGSRTDLFLDLDEKYYLGLRSSGRRFSYLSDGIRVDPYGYTAENLKKIST